MSMFSYAETAVRQRGVPKVDPYSQESVDVDWTTPDEAEVLGAFAPGSSVESFELARQPVTSKPTWYCDFGSDIRAGDRLVIRGVTYDVDGNPADWRSPFTGWQAGMAVTLLLKEG